MNIGLKLAVTFAILYVPGWAVAKANFGFSEPANIYCAVIAILSLCSALVGVWLL